MIDFLKEDAAFFLEDFGEPVTVTDPDGTKRPNIMAIVERSAPVVGSGGTKNEVRMNMEIANDPVTGISTSTVDFGKTLVTVAERIGGTPRDWHVVMPDDDTEWQDEGMITVGLK